VRTFGAEVTTATEGKKSRVISGMRPTGRLHIGHYFGALQNWVRLQNDSTYECFYFIADWHALTSDYADTSAIAQNTIEIMTDYLASGLDPKKSVIFQQSLVPEHAELHLLLSMVTPLGWLERVPTYKEALENVKDRDLHNYGFLGYPVLQCADIVIYSEGAAQLCVPVGEDQKSHVELSREIVRDFCLYFGLEIDRAIFAKENQNALLDITGTFSQMSIPDEYRLVSHSYPISEEVKTYWTGRIKRLAREEGIENYLSKRKSSRRFFQYREVLIEPSVMLTNTPRIRGTDGRKMSKSYNNFISLSESDESIWGKVRPMVTDPARKRRENPGNPEICPVYDWHKLFSQKETLEWASEGCRTARIGCIECKRSMADNLIKWITPVRERRLHYQHEKKLVGQFIQEGSVQARIIAQRTMIRVRDAVFGKNRVRRRNLRPLRKHQAG
jgi:tryptophanyl-tRNA synthetase